ncbi:MAG TPA: sigma 54-interacting transcriptional regulator [Candidatus Binataceae bacterium]|nr:sigma 54-interacting transcriptional regulator [Candidatus Binataceae bacterium]
MASEMDSARARLLYDLGCAFAARIELHELLPLIIEKCREALSAEGVAVVLLDPVRHEFFFPYVADADWEVARKLSGQRFPADLGYAGVVMSTGHSLKADDVQADPRHYHGTDKATGLVTRNLIAAPLFSRQGPIGVVEVVNRRGKYVFSEEDQRFLEALAGSIAIALDNARLYAEARQSEAKLLTQVGALRRDLARHDRFDDMVGSGPSMAEVFHLMETAAASSITVLIEGETGTGKELVARGIHRSSARAEGPFLAVNCAAMPETLLESELFGHRRGAFTGAIRDNPGLFRSATGGTVFLDEVGEMPSSMQAKLLRVLEQGEVIPVGESIPTKVDVRVLSATNRELRGEVGFGKFREDLFYRLAVFPIKMPPLRERREDIPLLVQRFLARAAERQQKHVVGFDEPALAMFASYSWPGNIRELQNEIERAVALARDNAMLGLDQISTVIRRSVLPGAELPNALHAASVSNASSPASDPEPLSAITAAHQNGSFREARAAFEARYITDILTRCEGNLSRAAKLMGMSRVQLQRKVKEYGLR